MSSSEARNTAELRNKLGREGERLKGRWARSRTIFNGCTATGTEGDTRVYPRLPVHLTGIMAVEVKRLVGRRERMAWLVAAERGIPAGKRKARVANRRVATLDTRHYFSAMPSTKLLPPRSFFSVPPSIIWRLTATLLYRLHRDAWVGRVRESTVNFAALSIIAISLCTKTCLMGLIEKYSNGHTRRG